MNAHVAGLDRSFLSTISGHTLEDVKARSSGPVFYQLYLMGGRAAAEAIIERARVAGFAGLVVTIDTPVSGIRERDYRNGMKELISGSLLPESGSPASAVDRLAATPPTCGHGTTRRPGPARCAARRVGKPRSALT